MDEVPNQQYLTKAVIPSSILCEYKRKYNEWHKKLRGDTGGEKNTSYSKTQRFLLVLEYTEASELEREWAAAPLSY